MVKSYEIAGFEFEHALSNNETYMSQQGYNLFQKVKFRAKVRKVFKAAEMRLKETLEKGHCYYGPFKGEFGHMLAHSLPFLHYLYSQGVKIHYCGMELHKPLLVDASGHSIIHKWLPLRDFFSEVSPSSNATIPPEDVQEDIAAFYQEAKASGFPLWDIGDQFYYWFVHRDFVEQYGEWPRLDLNHVKENSCVVFPRSKGAKESLNNGGAWDYPKLVAMLTRHFDKVYVCGHPSQVLEIAEMPGVEMRISTDNGLMLDACKRSKAIFSQHSGVFYLPCYLQNAFYLLYKGGKSYKDIGSFQNSVRFVNSPGSDYLSNRLHFVFDYSDIENLPANEGRASLEIENSEKVK